MTANTLLWLVTAIVPAIGDGVNLPARPSAADPPETVGVYRFAHQRLVGVRGLEDGKLRYTDFTTGESHTLYPAGPDVYDSASDWGSASPVALRYRFLRTESGGIRAIEVRSTVGGTRVGERIQLPSRSAEFASGDVRLHGRLVLPVSRGPHAVVVMVHGSEATSAVDSEVLPYYWAANGVAAFVFDKRGTGSSGGSYTQKFSVLASDVVAAVEWLKHAPEIDAGRIGVAGFSQGGWVAPLAAAREPAIRFAFIGYGLAMTVADEDRLEAPLKLRALGFQGEAIREFEELNALVHAAARAGFPEEGWSRIEARITEYQDREWLKALTGSTTWVGTILGMGLDQAREVVPGLFTSFFEPFYDPVPILESLNIPILWAIAGEDVEAPPGPTIEVLTSLRNSGRPIELVVFPGTDHGITTFTTAPDGSRVRTGYAPGYFLTMMEWLRQQTGSDG